MGELTQEIDWKKWRRQESNILAESISFAARVFSTTEKRIDSSRLYGTTLLVESIECARAIRICINKGILSPAFALARAQYEGALRGHIIIHEIEVKELKDFLRRIESWTHDKQSQRGLPKIVIRGTEWKIIGLQTKYDWRPLQHEIPKLFVGSVGSNSRNMELLHDLAHSGMTHALQLLAEDGNIEARYSDDNQTRLLGLADRAVMFSVMIWPGAEEMYRREIQQRIERTTQLRSLWADIISS